MTPPTATIFLPYHALDEVLQRGARAAQPAASAVVAGTLYCVTDEGERLERSNGTLWELYASVGSPGGTLPDVAAERLIGRGDGTAGPVQEITLGDYITMTGTQLDVTGAGATPFIVQSLDVARAVAAGAGKVPADYLPNAQETALLPSGYVTVATGTGVLSSVALIPASDVEGGAVGPQGPEGPQGVPGPTGPAGADGTDGVDGLPGAPGPTGPAGADGVDGVDGLPGATGPVGPQGETGLDGPMGPMGPDGPKGDTGDPGPAGADGADGVAGLHALTHLPAGTDPIPTMAVTDAANPWTVPQTLPAYSGVSGPANIFLIRDTAAPVDQQLWRLVSYSNNYLYLESMNDANTAVTGQPLRIAHGGSQEVYAHHLVTGAAGNVLADLTCSGGTNFQNGVAITGGAGLTVTTGGAAITGNTVVNTLTANIGGIAITGGALDNQSGMTYARVGARVALDPPNGYGLDTWFEESRNHIRAAGGLYDYARAVPIGDWTEFTPQFDPATTITQIYGCKYQLVGHTMTVCLYANLNFTGGGVPYMVIPGGASSGPTYSAGFGIEGSVTNICWMFQSPPNTNILYLYRDCNGTGWTPGPRVVVGSVIFQIA